MVPISRRRPWAAVRSVGHSAVVASDSEKERQWLERTRHLLNSSADLAAPGIGAAAGVVGGPPGLLGGFLLGVAAERALLRIGAEFEQRHLGPREKTRVAGTLYFALSKVRERLEAGEPPREDPFFEESGVGRARADELLEAILVAAQSDHEEQKAQHMGALYASFVFDPSVTRGDANYLIGIAAQLTFHELVLLALFHGPAGYRGVPGWERLHPYEWRAQAIAGEIFELSRRGLLVRTDARPILTFNDANPSELWVSPTGCKLYHLMRLDEINEDRCEEVTSELEEISQLPIPTGLIRKLEEAVDSEPLSHSDLVRSRVRIQATHESLALLPEPGTDLWANLRGFELEAVVAAGGEGYVELKFQGLSGDEFQAILESEAGRVLRVAPLPDGALALD